MKAKFLISLIIFFLSHSSENAQDENVIYNDTLTKKLFQIKKDYSKRIFESTYYTIQIYFGDLKNADSILIDFQENHEGTRLFIAHRYGDLWIGDVSVLIAAASAHRAPAFDAARQAIEDIKVDVPIFKQEKTTDGDTWIGWGGG